MARRTNASSKDKDRKMAPRKAQVTPGMAGNKQQSPGRRPGRRPEDGDGRRNREQ
jgi:hypothetical protein